MRAVAPGPDGRLELLQVQAGQLRRQPPASARSAGSTRHSKVTRWRSAVQRDPLGQRTSTRVAGVDVRQEGADPENVHA